MTTLVDDIKILFKTRRAAYNKSTDEILDVLRPTLLVAAEEFFKTKVTWIEVLLLDGFVTAIGTIDSDKIVRVAVPFNVLEMDSKDEIVQFFVKMSKEEPLELEDNEVLYEPEFSNLSDEQKEKLSIFEKMQTKEGKVH